MKTKTLAFDELDHTLNGDENEKEINRNFIEKKNAYCEIAAAAQTHSFMWQIKCWWKIKTTSDHLIHIELFDSLFCECYHSVGDSNMFRFCTI